jgi:Chaperone of endosialidase
MKATIPLIETPVEWPFSRFSLILVVLVLVSFGTAPLVHAVSPAPDGGYPGGNTAEGQQALLSLAGGTYNTALGFLSLKSNTTAGFNTAIGAGALLANTADFNTASGAGALLGNTTGAQNTAIGALALLNNTTGSDNTANGYGALQLNTTGSLNTAVGLGALQVNSTGDVNTADGALSLSSNTTGVSNTATGAQALFVNSTGSNNTAHGYQALAAATTGGGNTAVGYQALNHNITGSNNVALGFGAGSNITTASDTICIGIVGVDVTDGCYVGHIFQEAIDPDNLAMAIDVHGKLGTPASSRRFKDDIKPMDKASEAILALKPVTFHYKNDKKRRAQFGLIAEEVAEVDSNLVARDKEGKPYSVRYDQVNAMLLNEFLKEHRRVEQQGREMQEQAANITTLKATVARQQKGMEALTAQLKEQAVHIQKVTAQVELNGTAPQMVVGNR